MQINRVQPHSFSWTTNLCRFMPFDLFESLKVQLNWLLGLCVSSLCNGHATNHEFYRKCFALLLGFECPLHSHPLQAFCTAFARRSAQLGKCHHGFPEKFIPQKPFLEVGLHIVGIGVQWCSHKRFCSGLQVFPRDLQIFEIGASLWL